MTKEVVVRQDETLAPASEAAWFRAEVERLREGNAALLKENHRLRDELTKMEVEKT